VVVDASILVAALSNPSGLASDIVRAWRSAKSEGFVSEMLMEEVRRASRSGKVRNRPVFDEGWAEEVLAFLATRVAESNAWPIQQSTICDVTDTHVLSLALLVRADLIVSGDQDLQAVGVPDGIPVVDIHAFAYTIGVEH
jgi:putative PIN family toxin of toxin-antitoxin system